MSNTVVIYKSCYGSAKQYAAWIAEELGADLLESKPMLNEQQLKQYDILIWGSGVYSGQVNGLEVVDRNASWMKEKKVILFTCGVVDPEKETYRKRLREDMENRISASLLKKIEVFHFPGELDYKKLKFMHKTMMKSTYKMIKRTPEAERSQGDKEIFESYGKVQGHLDRSCITPLVTYVKELEQKS